MKIKSISFDGETAPSGTKFEGQLDGGKYIVTERRQGWFFDTVQRHELSVAGAEYHLLSAERSAGKAAVGFAVAGVVGAALGAGKKHTFAIHYPDAIMVAEFTASELRQLGALGVVAGRETPGEPSTRSAPVERHVSGGALGMLVLLVICCGLLQRCIH